MNGGSHLAGGNHPKLGGSYMTCPSCLLESPCRLQTCYKFPLVFSKIPCFCHQLPPTASFPGLIIAITVHLWHLLCRIHRIKVARYTGMAKNHFAAACFSYFILTMYRYIYIYIYNLMHTQIHTYMSDCENPRFTERTFTNLGRSHRLPHVCTIMIYGKLGGYRWYRLQETAVCIIYDEL